MVQFTGTLQREIGAALSAAALFIVLATGQSLSGQGAGGAAPGGRVAVAGVVYDSIARAPLAGATVQFLREVPSGPRELFEASTDADGRYAISNLTPGDYSAGFLHARLDSLGPGAPLIRVALQASTTDVPLAIPSLRTLARALCRSAMVLDSATLWVGVVRDAASAEPRAGAAVSVQWAELQFSKAGLHSVRHSGIAQTGADGRFTVCNAPVDAVLFARAAQGPDTSNAVVLRFPPTGLIVRDLFVGASEPAAAESTVVVDGKRLVLASPRRGPARLTGTVRASTGAALAGAQVQLAGSGATAVSGDDGSFQLWGLPAGSGMLEARRVGFEPVRVNVDLRSGSGADNRATVVLENAITTLDTVRIITGPADVLVKSGFADRKQGGIGHFIDRAAIERRRAVEVKNLVLDLPGMLVMPRTIGGGPSLFMRVNGGLCVPTVFVDGFRFTGQEAEDFLAVIDPSTVAGIEVYSRPGMAPLQFGGTSANGCGVIVVWTDGGRRAGRKPSP